MAPPKKQFLRREDGKIFYSGAWRSTEAVERIRKNLRMISPQQRKICANRRQEWIDGHGPCQRCGGSENLTVDHIDPRSKAYDINHLWGRSEKIRESELEKCQVLCASCHGHKTIEDIRLGLCGATHTIWVKPTHCRRGHELTPENIYLSRKRRICKECLRRRTGYSLKPRNSAIGLRPEDEG